jgi:hypothetical protein
MRFPEFGHCFIDHSGTNRCGGLLDPDHGRKVVVLNWHASFQPNNRESTFGFHTAYTRPERNRTMHAVLEARDRNTDEQTIQYQQASLLHKQLQTAKTDVYFLNALKILGYCPLIGLIPCAVRLIAPLMDKDNSMWCEPEDVRKAEFTRGAFEGLGIGICYLIPDIIATVKRFSK